MARISESASARLRTRPSSSSLAKTSIIAGSLRAASSSIACAHAASVRNASGSSATRTIILPPSKPAATSPSAV